MPEASAASFRLEALAQALCEAGDDVTVLTTRPPAGQQGPDPAFSVRRFPVLRDATGAVRGYLQYLSFDVPLAFRLLFARRPDAVITEPPPTTAFVVRLVCGLRRIPYFAYAADVWSDAAQSAGAPRVAVSVVRWMERVSWNAATGVFSVNDGVTDRVAEIAPRAVISTVGNGVNTDIFRPDGPSAGSGQFLIYTGTASEWQGAEILIAAMPLVAQSHPEAELVFLGQGSAWAQLTENARQTSGAKVRFISTVPPAEAAAWLRGAAASVASLRPGMGYDFAFPTKVFASWATGTPVVYVGPGPATDVIAKNPQLGVTAPYERSEVARAMSAALADHADSRTAISDWAEQNVSLRGVASRAVAFLRERLGR